jgi:DNA-binding transcriptional ArsR family regulator
MLLVKEQLIFLTTQCLVTSIVVGPMRSFKYGCASSYLMPKESFMLVSLKEDKAKKLAQVMSNPTCTKILDYLAGKDATESQIAKELSIPLSTVHYNLQQLVEAKLVVAEEFHYSEKGREVNHYKLANKYIIIAPQEDDSFLQHLRKYLPVGAIVLGAGIILKVMQWLTPEATAQIMAKAVQEAAPEAASGAADAAFRTMAADAPAPTVAPHWWQSPLADYFVAGAVFVLILIIIVEAINYLRSRR